MLIWRGGYTSHFAGIGDVFVHWISSLEQDNGNEEIRCGEIQWTLRPQDVHQRKQAFLRV